MHVCTLCAEYATCLDWTGWQLPLQNEEYVIGIAIIVRGPEVRGLHTVWPKTATSGIVHLSGTPHALAATLQPGAQKQLGQQGGRAAAPVMHHPHPPHAANRVA